MQWTEWSGAFVNSVNALILSLGPPPLGPCALGPLGPWAHLGNQDPPPSSRVSNSTYSTASSAETSPRWSGNGPGGVSRQKGFRSTIGF